MTENTKTNKVEQPPKEDDMKTEPERGPLKIVINTIKGTTLHITENCFIINEVNDEAVDDEVN